MAKFKVFPYRLHTAGGHVIQIHSEFTSPSEIMEYLKDKEFVDIFWTQSTNGNIFVPFILKCSSVEIIAPVFGRSGITVEKDDMGNIKVSANKVEEAVAQPKIGQVVKKRN